MFIPLFTEAKNFGFFNLFLLFYKGCRLDFLASFFSKTKQKSVKKFSAQCSMNEGKVTCIKILAVLKENQPKIRHKTAMLSALQLQ